MTNSALPTPHATSTCTMSPTEHRPVVRLSIADPWRGLCEFEHLLGDVEVALPLVRNAALGLWPATPRPIELAPHLICRALPVAAIGNYLLRSPHTATASMAAIRSAVRAAPRAHLLRPTTARRVAPLAQRSYASAPSPLTRRPADDTKSADQAEAASEDLAGNDDPNMVSLKRDTWTQDAATPKDCAYLLSHTSHWNCTRLIRSSLHQNGNYPDPSLTSALPIKRQFRDPHGDWWDPVERRNYGEPVHEDNDVLGIFTTEAYTHFTPGWGGVLVGCFVASVGVLMAVVSRTYPDKVSAYYFRLSPWDEAWRVGWACCTNGISS